MKKISNLFIILVLTFAFTFALPQKEADAIAWGLAVPGGITIGAGAYTVGALALAGVVGIAGYDTYSEEINAHALRAWENGTQLSKDSMNLMINSAKDLGNVLTATDTGFNTWVDGQLTAISAIPIDIKYGNITVDSSKMACNCSAWDKKYTDSTSSTLYGFSKNGAVYTRLYVTTNATIDIWFQGAIGTGNDIVLRFPKTTENANALGALQNPEQVIAFVKSFGVAFGFGLAQTYKDDYLGVKTKVNEAWQDMKDAGLVLPVDNAIPVYQGNAVNYNAQTDVYTGVDGGVVAKGDLTWSFPQPRIRTGEELDVTVPPGVYVDNPAGVYSPSLPTTAIPDIAIPTTTNITTGVTTDIPKTGTGEPPPPTGGTTPKGEPVNPFKGVVPGASLLSLFKLLVAIIWYLIRMFTFVATIAFIAPTPIDNPYFMWFTTATFYGITPFPLVQNLALFFLGFSIYKSIRRVF